MPYEITLVRVLAEGVRRGLIGQVIHRFERKGLKLLATRMVRACDVVQAKAGDGKEADNTSAEGSVVCLV